MKVSEPIMGIRSWFVAVQPCQNIEHKQCGHVCGTGLLLLLLRFGRPRHYVSSYFFLVDGGDALDVVVVGVQRLLRASMSRHFVVPCSRVILQFVSAEMDFKSLLSRFCFRKRRQGKFSRPTSKT